MTYFWSILYCIPKDKALPNVALKVFRFTCRLDKRLETKGLKNRHWAGNNLTSEMLAILKIPDALEPHICILFPVFFITWLISPSLLNFHCYHYLSSLNRECYQHSSLYKLLSTVKFINVLITGIKPSFSTELSKAWYLSTCHLEQSDKVFILVLQLEEPFSSEQFTQHVYFI